jgi:methylamine---glutamate N-methyltransferase subunit B
VDDSHLYHSPADVILPVPEIRDYHALNSEVVRHLDAGCTVIRLAGVQGQRLLAAGLAGPWDAVIEIDGDAGPELAAGMDAPGLTVVALGRAADGAGSRLRAGRLLAVGDVDVAFAYAQRGGQAVAGGHVGARAGLCQSGGDLVLLSGAGHLAGERQAGGRIFVPADRVGPHAGRGHRHGRFIRIDPVGLSDGDRTETAADRAVLVALLRPLRPWLGPAPQGFAGSSDTPG